MSYGSKRESLAEKLFAEANKQRNSLSMGTQLSVGTASSGLSRFQKLAQQASDARAARTDVDLPGFGSRIIANPSEQHLRALAGEISPQRGRLTDKASEPDFTSPEYLAEKERLRTEAAREFGHNMTDWGQTNIRNFAVNPDAPMLAGLTNYLQLLRQSGKGVEYEQFTAQEQEAKKQKELEAIQDWAAKNAVAASAGSIVTSPLSGADYLLNLMETATLGKSLPSSTPGAAETTQALRSGASENMGKVGQFVYHTGMSAVDSLVAGWLGGGSVGGGIILGLGAASNAANDIKQRGGSDAQALIGGAVSGILEGVFEKISIGNLEVLKDLPEVTLKNLLKNTAKSVLVNASEEAVTEFANAVFDTVFMGNLSNFRQMVNQYIAANPNASYEDAKRYATHQIAAQIGESALSGGLMGVFFGALGSGSSYRSNQKTGKMIVNADAQQEVLSQAMAFPVSSDTYSMASQLSRKNGEITKAEVGALYRTMAADIEAGIEPAAQQDAHSGAVGAPVVGNVEGQAQGADATTAAETGAVGVDKQNSAAAFIAAGDDVLTATAKGAVMDRVLAGDQTLTNKHLRRLNMNSPSTRKVFEQLTGTAVPMTTDTTTLLNTARAAVESAAQAETANAPAAAESGAAGVNTQTDATTEQQEMAIKAALAAIPTTGTPTGHADAAQAQQNKPRYDPLELIRPDLAAINRKTTVPNVVENTTGVDYTVSENKEGVSDGSTVHLRESGEWLDGADPAGSVSAVEGGAGQNQSGAVQRRSADGEISRVTYGEEVSAAQLGIEGGSTAKNIRIVTGGETSSINSARQIAQERGLQLTLFAGDNLSIRGRNGSAISARAYVSGNQVFVRADHPAFTADQLMRHEAGHDMITKGEIDPDNVRERIHELHGAEKLDELSRMYADAYAGSGMTAAEIWEEIICDSLGDMNIFSGKAGETTTAEMLNETKSISSEMDAAVEGKASRELRAGWASERAAKYTYEGLTTKPDMTITAIDDTVQYKADRFTRKQIVKDAIKNAAAIGRTNESGGVSVYVKDVGADVLLGTEGLKHGLDRRLQENAAVTLKAGELLQNAIRINEVTPQKDSASRAYVLLGVAKNSANEPYIVEFVVNRYDNTVASVDVLYSVNAKKESAVLNAPKLTEKPLLVTDSTISIAQLLDLASKYFPDVLPESVLRHFGYTSRPDGKLGQSALFSRETDTPDTLDEDQQDMVTSTQEAVRAAVREELERMGKEYGWIKPGENPYREVQVPKRTAADNKVSQTVRTILEAGVTPDTIIPDIEELVSQGEFSYDVYSDKAAIADAESVIRDKGYATSLAEWMIGVDKGIVSKANTTLGWALYNAAVNSGDTKTAIDILNRMVEHQHNAAQAVQATRILKKLSPDAQLYAAQRSIRNLQEEINKRYKSDVKLKIDEELAEEFMQAATEEERAEALRQIYRNVGKQVPSRFIDKWNAWRYLALLGNVRTHVRNVVGNAGFVPVVMAKNAVATGLETAASKISGGKTQRSKALVGFGQQDMKLLKAAFGDYGNAADYVGAGKYSDFVNMKSEIEEGRRIFKTKWLEKVRKANSMALSMEDEWFAKTHYAYALAQYCKANGISAQQITEGNIPDAARLHAIKEAKKATYQDVNQLSELFSRIGRYRGDNTVMQGMSKVVEGILPFRKTPANILARGLEYSPLGIIKTIGDFRKVKSGDATMAEVWDDLASTLTGTGLMALGAFAALSGLVRGSGEEDDDEREFNELMGHQSYALELPDGTSITLDWLAPECLPFFVGVNLCEAVLQRQEDGKALTMADILGAIGKVSDPMLEMSCLQSLSDVFDSVGYASSNDMNPLLSALVSAATSYLTQGLPTLLGQFERSGEETRMTTYTEKNAFLTPDMQYFIGKASSRIPVLDYNQIPYIDAWGRTEDGGNLAERIFNNVFNPAYTSNIDTSQMETELLRLYEATSDGGVFPSRADKYFNVNKQRKDLTAEEYVKYATARGQTAMEIITDLTENSEYKKLEDTDKAAVVKLCYELANAQAKTEVSEYQPDGWIAKALKCCEENNIPLELYIICYQAQRDVEGLKDKDGDPIANSRGLLVMQAVNKIGGLTYAQRLAMFAQFGVGGSVILYMPEKVDTELKKMGK